MLICLGQLQGLYFSDFSDSDYSITKIGIFGTPTGRRYALLGSCAQYRP